MSSSSSPSRQSQDGASGSEPAIDTTPLSKLASQLKELFTNDSTILTTLAETIAQSLLNSSSLVDKVADKLRQELKDDVTQNVYESISLDLEQKTDDLKNLHRDHSATIKKLSALEKKIGEYESKLDDYEQYSRRNCLLIHGIDDSQTRSENTTKITKDTIKQYLGIDLDEGDIDRSHRLGRKNQAANSNNPIGIHSRPRPIIVKFCSYAMRDRIFKAKRQLKATGIVITESLTSRRMDLLNATKSHESVKSAWSIDGRISCLTSDGRRVTIYNTNDIEKL